MAKSFNNIYDSIVNYSNLELSLDKVLQGRRDYTEHSTYSLHREKNLGELLHELDQEIWMPGKPRTFRLFEPKQRDIIAAPFIDRIVHHAVNTKIEHLFTNKYIHHSYACIRGKGAQRAVHAVQKMMRSYDYKFKNPYIIQADISKYFNSINHDIVIEEFNKTIKCKKTRLLLESFIRSHNTTGTGIPIGSLISQLGANVNMNIVDQRMVNHYGFGKYVRYMDDIIIFCESKSHAKEALQILTEECNIIKLTMNPKTNYFPTKRGVDFVGYRTFNSHILPRKRVIKNLRNSIKEMTKLYNKGLITFDEIRPKLASHLGYASHCRSMNSVNSLISEFMTELYK